MASYQPLPYAKRQKITSAEPNLRPQAPREPTYHQPAATYESSSSSQPSTSRSIVTRGHPPPSSEDLPSNGLSKRQRDENLHKSSGTTKAKTERGNYLGYYSKRRTDVSSRDPRLALVPAEWFKGARVLDVGCNTGAVTIEVAQRFSPERVIGVDIDDDLIKLASKQVDLAWSRQSPVQAVLEAANNDTRDLPPHQQSDRPPLPEAGPPPIPRYFPLAFPRLYGYLPTPPRHLLTTYEEQKGEGSAMPKASVAFPKNISFDTADWPSSRIAGDARGYHIIIAFSITKWIHLHGLNEGLHAFFAKAFASLLPGGRLILEPQPFSTYAKSARGTTLKDNFVQLRDAGGWRDENGDFKKVLLEDIGFESADELGETGEKGFRRPVVVYTKRKGDWV